MSLIDFYCVPAGNTVATRLSPGYDGKVKPASKYRAAMKEIDSFVVFPANAEVSIDTYT